MKIPTSYRSVLPKLYFKETLCRFDFLYDVIKIAGRVGFSVFNRGLCVFGYASPIEYRLLVGISTLRKLIEGKDSLFYFDPLCISEDLDSF